MVQTGDVIELRRASDGHFHATLEVNGRPVRFMVDTGATDIVLSRRDAERVGVDPARLSYLGMPGPPTAPWRPPRSGWGWSRFGDVTDTDVRASVSGGTLDVSLLGMAYLDRFASIEITGDTHARCAG